jgi:hypothetical protein
MAGKSPAQRKAERRAKAKARRGEERVAMAHSAIVTVLTEFPDPAQALAIVKRIEKQILEFQSVQARFYGNPAR